MNYRNIRAEEQLLENHLESAYLLMQLAMNRDPQVVKTVIEIGSNAIERIQTFYEEIKQLKSTPKTIEDRQSLLHMARAKLFLFNVDTSNLTQSNLPPIDKVVTHSHLLEMVIGNIYMSASLTRSFMRASRGYRRREKITRAAQRFLSEFSGTVRDYELSHKIYGDSYRRNSTGRAHLLYALELLAQKPKNVLEEVKESGDYSILYGKKGIQFEVKEARVFPGHRELCKQHSGSLNRGERFSYSAVRVLFTDVIPVYEPKNVGVV